MKKGLVLEGGGKRGIYAAGVLDVFMENGIKFDGLIGTSAGAVNGCSYVSGQYERNIRCNLRLKKEKKYMTFEKSATKFYATCSNVETGKAEYILCESLRGKNMDYLRASASLPYVSQIVEIGGKKLLDGGVCDSIPLKAFQNMGYKKNVVVLTRPKGYMKTPENNIMAQIFYGKYPEFISAMKNRYAVYNRTLKYIEEQEKAGNIILLRPTQTIEVGRMEQDGRKIKAMYDLGKRDAERRLEEIFLFLN